MRWNVSSLRVQRALRISASVFISCGTCLAAIVPSAHATPLSYLQNLLDATPQGGWVQVNSSAFSSAWATPEQGGLPPGSYSNPGAVVMAWSSVAWDSARGNLMLWGGGHANYMGNEMYIWRGGDGTWTRGSLPTRLESSPPNVTVDGVTPQSAHTYDNNLYVPINDRFVTFGGAAFNSGGVLQTRLPDGSITAAGPYFFDPSKADPNKVGGMDGSGYLPSIQGGMMWSNQRGNWTGLGDGPSHAETNSAYRAENGKDVIYVTADSHASGWQSLYRYELGNAAANSPGHFTRVGVSWYAPAYQSTATIDLRNELYIHTSALGGLGVWSLADLPVDSGGGVADCKFEWTPSADRCLFDRYISLIDESGAEFQLDDKFGMNYDSHTGRIVLWNGAQAGTVYETQAMFNADGSMSSTWKVQRRDSSTAAQPMGNFVTGALGKWVYVDELRAFIALDEYNATTQDAPVWLYKPYATDAVEPTTPVPLVDTLSLSLLGLSGALFLRRRASRPQHR